MSSRALRKLQGEAEIVIPQLEDVHSSDSGAENDVGQTSLASAQNRKRQKKKKKKAAINPFELLIDGDEEEEADEDEEPEADQINDTVESTPVVPANHLTKTKKKKKKKKKNKEVSADPKTAKDEDDIDASIREVNEMLGELPVVSNQAVFDSDVGVTMDMKALLTVEHKYLNPDNEMRRIFGAGVIQPEQNQRRGRNKPYRKTTWLTRPKDTWPRMGKTGLSMNLLQAHQGCQYFTFEHSHAYQQIQFQFWDAVESLNPQNIAAVLQLQPYHADSLIQLSEVCKMGEDVRMATELIERALYVFENSFHALFSLTQGNCRLDYRRAENRAFYITLFRHLIFVGQRGCYRTAVEFCKLLLSLDPDGDPLCVLLMLDFYALRSEQYGFLIRMFNEWEAHRNLSRLPNFAFSVPLAMFLQSDGENTEEADEKLQEALLTFPGVLIPLLDKCGVTPDAEVTKHAFFSTVAQLRQPDALKQLVALYVGRCHACWKEPQVMLWLETNVRLVLKRVDTAESGSLDKFHKITEGAYRGTPRNIYRHIIMSEIKDATAALPPEMAHSPVLSYDPLPPTDSIVTYSRPERVRRVQEDSSALSMFFRSLLPNFNPDEIVEEPQGAAGGQDLRQGVGALMEAMRDLLQNIQPVAPPVENEQNNNNEGGEPEDNLEEWD